MRKIYYRNIFIGLSFVILLSSAIMSASGPGAGYTNAPGESNCTSCHGGSIITSNNTNLNNLRLTSNFTGGGYLPDSTYTVEITFKQTGRTKFGFEVTCLDENNNPAGTFTSNTSRTSKVTGTVSGKTREYIQHSSNGTSNVGTDSTRWTFAWKAPSSNIGNLKFYVVVMAANNNSTNDAGDIIYGKVFNLGSSSLLPVASISTNDSVTCTHYTVQLNGSATNNPTTWSWKFPGGNPIGSSNQNPTVVYTLAGTKQVILTVKNSKGVSEPDTFNIQVNGSPAASIITGSSATICEGDSLLISANTGANITYNWLHNGKTTRTVYIKDTGNYRVKVTSVTNGCERTSNPFRLNLNHKPTIFMAYSGPDSVCSSFQETFSTSGTDIDSVHWYVNGVLARRTKSLTTVFSGNSSIIVQAKGKSINGCFSDLSDTAKVHVVPAKYPNAFNHIRTTSTIQLNWRRTQGITSHLYDVDGSGFNTVPGDTVLQLSGLMPNTEYAITIRSMQASPCLFTDTTIRVRTSVCSNLMYSIDFTNRTCKGNALTATIRQLAGQKYSISFNGQAFSSDTIYTFVPAQTDSLRITILDSLSPTCPPIMESLAYTIDTLTDKDTSSGAGQIFTCDDSYQMEVPAVYQEYEFFKNGISMSVQTSNTYVFTGLNTGDELTATGRVNTCSRTYGKLIFNRHPAPDPDFTFTRNWKTYTFRSVDSTYASYTWKADGMLWGSGPVFVRDLSDFNDSALTVSLVTVTSNGCIDSSEQLVTVPNLNNIRQSEYGSFKVYPNPFRDRIEIENPSAGYIQVRIADMQGRIVSKLYTDGTAVIIPSADWTPGTYFLFIESADGSKHSACLIKL